MNLLTVDQMENRSITVNRNELYEQVWSEPVSRLAPKYGIPDVGLKKICRKLNVPTGGRAQTTSRNGAFTAN